MDLLLDMFHVGGEWETDSHLAGRLQAFHKFLVTRCLLPAESSDRCEKNPEHQLWPRSLVGKLKEWKDVIVERLTNHQGELCHFCMGCLV